MGRVVLPPDEEHQIVEPVGDKNAKIAIVMSHPNDTELRQKKPLVGYEGRMINSLLRKSGINRYNDVYLTYAVKYRPEAGNIFNLYDYGKEPSFEYRAERAKLKEELAEIDPNVIIALGQEAMKVLTNWECEKIDKWRGSVIMTDMGKVIPTYRPERLRKVYREQSIALLDFDKARYQSTTKEHLHKKRILHDNPTFDEIEEYIQRCEKADMITFDIETMTSCQWFIDTIGIAISSTEGMSIPLTKPDGTPVWSIEEELYILQRIADLLSNPDVKKIGQNGQYDIVFLERIGIPVVNYYFDTMVASKTLYPEYPKGLDFLVSIYTQEKYYKDTSTTERQKYNAKDVVYTYDVAEQLIEDLKDFDMYDFYINHVHPLIRIYIDIQHKGVKVDHKIINNVSDYLDEDIGELRSKLKELTGKDINVYSVVDMREYIYDDLEMPKKYNKNDNLDTSRRVLEDFYRKTGREEFNIMMKLRKVRSRKSTYINAEKDIDGRIRSSYDVAGTETGRLASKKAVNEKGMNLQNVTHGVYREMFIADEGTIFLGADLAQAENRVVAYLCEDENMLKVVNSEGDMHTNNAAMIFNKDPEDITYEERQLGKRITHGCLLPEAQVLTKKGWVQFKNLKEGVEIAQFDPENKSIEFVVPKICKFEHDGIMLKANGRNHKNVYTPGHRIPYITRSNYKKGKEKIQFKHAINIANAGERPGKLPVSGKKYEGRMNLEDDFIRMLVMVQADMSLEKTGSIRGSFKKDRKKRRVIEILENAGIKYNIQKSSRKNYLRIYIEVEEAKKIRPFFKKGKVFGDWVYELPYHSAKVFIEEVQFWDGSSYPTQWLYDTTVKENAEKVQTVAHLCGHIASFNSYENNKNKSSFGDPNNSKLLYRVIIREGQYVGLRKEHWSTFNYKGDVYSLKVPKTAYLTKYDNCIIVTGNTNYQMGFNTLARYAQTTVAEAKEMYKQYHNRFSKLKKWHKKIEKKIRQDRILENPFGRKRAFYDRMGGGLFRDATSFIPQSTVADVVHRATRKMHARLPHPARIVLNLHDAITIQSPPELKDRVAQIMKEELEKPFEVDGKELSIPIDVLEGKNWEEVS